MITHPEHQGDYDAGKAAMKQDIAAFGVAEAANKWRLENPTEHKSSSLGAYYYAKAGLDLLVESGAARLR